MTGVEKIAQAADQVADLQVSLKEEQIIVEEKKAQTDKLIVEIGKEKAIVDEAVEAGREVRAGHAARPALQAGWLWHCGTPAYCMAVCVGLPAS